MIERFGECLSRYIYDKIRSSFGMGRKISLPCQLHCHFLPFHSPFLGLPPFLCYSFSLFFSPPPLCLLFSHSPFPLRLFSFYFTFKIIILLTFLVHLLFTLLQASISTLPFHIDSIFSFLLPFTFPSVPHFYCHFLPPPSLPSCPSHPTPSVPLLIPSFLFTHLSSTRQFREKRGRIIPGHGSSLIPCFFCFETSKASSSFGTRVNFLTDKTFFAHPTLPFRSWRKLVVGPAIKFCDSNETYVA